MLQRLRCCFSQCSTLLRVPTVPFYIFGSDAMLCHGRRFLFVLIGFLVVPFCVGALSRTSVTSSDELRDLAPPPGLPADVAEWFTFPSRADAYLRDHFGLRRNNGVCTVCKWHLWLRGGTSWSSLEVTGGLLLRGAEMVEQSTGRTLRTERVIETANTIGLTQTALKAQGANGSSPVHLTRLPFMLTCCQGGRGTAEGRPSTIRW